MSSWRLHVSVCLGLAVLTLVCLARICSCGFIAMDDPTYVVHNPMVRAGLTPESCAEALTSSEGQFWIPMTWLSLQLDSSLYGYPAIAEQGALEDMIAERNHRPPRPESDAMVAGAWGFHLTNLVLHLADVLLAYWVFFRMTGAVGRSALVAALFAIHPLHVESVAWVTERKDVLSAFFFLLTLLAYVRYVRQPTISRYLLVLLPAFLGMASKPMVVTLPAVLLLLDYWPLGRFDWGQARSADKNVCPTAISWQGALLEKVPLFAVSLGFCLFTMHVQQSTISANSLSLHNRLAGSVAGYSWYLQKTFVPTDLCILYLYREDLTFSPAEILLLLGLLAVTLYVVMGARRRPYALVGWFWFLGMLFPVIGLVAQSGLQAYADRFIYLPHLGLFLWLVWAAADFCDRWKIPRLVRMSLAGAVIGLLGWTTFQQTAWWKDTKVMMDHCLDLDNDNHRAQAILAIYYWGRHEYANAVVWGDKAQAKAPQIEVYYYPIAMSHAKLGQYAEAEGRSAEAERQRAQADALLDQWLRLPINVKTHFNAALIYNVLGQYGKMAEQLEEQLKIVPENPEVHTMLWNAYKALGQLEKARAHLERAAELRSGGDR